MTGLRFRSACSDEAYRERLDGIREDPAISAAVYIVNLTLKEAVVKDKFEESYGVSAMEIAIREEALRATDWSELTDCERIRRTRVRVKHLEADMRRLMDKSGLPSLPPLPDGDDVYF